MKSKRLMFKMVTILLLLTCMTGPMLTAVAADTSDPASPADSAE